MVCCFVKCKFCLRRKFVVGIFFKKMCLIKLVLFKMRFRENECICKKNNLYIYFKLLLLNYIGQVQYCDKNILVY